MNEKISMKIRKLLELSKSSNENEARNAMMKAQEMLVKYKLTLKEVESIELQVNDVQEHETKISFTSKRYQWKDALSDVIVNNFGCMKYYTSMRGSTRRYIVFMGRTEDVNIANIVFEYALLTINDEVEKLKRQYRREKKSIVGVENDFASGFVDGLREQFEEQKRKNQEWGLVLSVPKEVEEAYDNINFSRRTFRDENPGIINADIYNKGDREGRRFSISDKIARNDEDDIKMIV